MHVSLLLHGTDRTVKWFNYGRGDARKTPYISTGIEVFPHALIPPKDSGCSGGSDGGERGGGVCVQWEELMETYYYE